MTVHELITELQKYPPEAQVVKQYYFMGDQERYMVIESPMTYIAVPAFGQGKKRWEAERYSGSGFPHGGFVIIRR